MLKLENPTVSFLADRKSCIQSQAPGRGELAGVAFIYQPLQLLQTAVGKAQRSRRVYTIAQPRPSGQNR